MEKKLYIYDKEIDVESFILCYLIKRKIPTFVVNNMYYLNKNRGDKVGCECSKCGKYFIRPYFTVNTWNDICTACLKKEKAIKRWNERNKIYTKISAIIDMDKSVYECCILKNHHHTFIINQKVYLKRLDNITGTCNVCGKKFYKKYYSVDSYEKTCGNCIREKTTFELYGVKNNFNTQAATQTIRKKYGVDSINQIPEVKEKKKKVFKEKYGDENPWSFGKPKFNNIIKERYGVENVLQNIEILKKAQKTNIKRYGVKSQLCLKDVKQNGMVLKYGVKHNSLLEEVVKLRSIKFYLKTKKKYEDKYILLTPIEEYRNRNKYFKLTWECKKCNTIFNQFLANGIEIKCPKCYPHGNKFSNLEKEVVGSLRNMGLYIEENNRNVISPYELDIYIHSHKLAIEFNGTYWHSSFYKSKWYHQYKTERCDRLGIRLIHIYEWEWVNDKEKCINKINYYLNNNEKIKSRKPIPKFIKNGVETNFKDYEYLIWD